jgi:hypothetical protein
VRRVPGASFFSRLELDAVTPVILPQDKMIERATQTTTTMYTPFDLDVNMEPPTLFIQKIILISI